MKKNVLVALLLLLLALPGLQAQVRYLDEIYTTVQVDSNVVYGKNYGFLTNFNTLQDLKMDVYQAVGDTGTHRPVIILMHAGSFLPGSVTGFYDFSYKDENCMVEMCKRFAKRGWVAVSMTYRLGWNPTSPDAEVRASTIINAVYRAEQDVKNAVRYFRSTYTDSANKWGIDGNKFVLGGTNSGAYVALAAGNLNKPAELVLPKFLDNFGNSFVDTTKTGNFDGFGGTQNHDNFPGISSAFNCVLSLGGAVADTSFIEAGEPAVIAFQGAQETLTPYNTAVVQTTTLQSVIEVSGSGDFMPVVAARGGTDGFAPNTFGATPLNHDASFAPRPAVDGLFPFYGQAFEPWSWYNGPNPAVNSTASQTKAMLYIDTIMGYSTPRLYKLLYDPSFGEPSGIREVQGNIEMQVYPSPANQQVSVTLNSLQKPLQTIRVMDLTGRLVTEINSPHNYHQNLDVSLLPQGTYLLQVTLTDGTMATRRFSIHH